MSAKQRPEGHSYKETVTIAGIQVCGDVHVRIVSDRGHAPKH